MFLLPEEALFADATDGSGSLYQILIDVLADVKGEIFLINDLKNSKKALVIHAVKKPGVYKTDTAVKAPGDLALNAPETFGPVAAKSLERINLPTSIPVLRKLIRLSPDSRKTAINPRRF